MQPSLFVDQFDLDISLRDAALDPQVSPTRRAIANLCLGMEIDDGYYSVRELREAVQWVHEGEPQGRAKLTGILGNHCDDFQRALFYCLAGRGVLTMLDDLVWLEQVLKVRGRVAGKAQLAGVSVAPLVGPYETDDPAGPVGVYRPDFEQGPSWWLEGTRQASG